MGDVQAREPEVKARELWILAAAVFVVSLWVNASFLVDDPDGYRLFPPFVAGVNANENTLLGAEYRLIANALADGKGFSDPFGVETGPTAWMPPVYPLLLAALIKLSAWHALFVFGAVLLLKNLALIVTGLTVVATARATARVLPPWLALALYGVWLVGHFWWFFQHTHDTWLILLLLDLVLLAVWWWLPQRPEVGRFALWGLLGGVLFLTSPVAGLAWAAAAAVSVMRTRRVGLTLAAIGLAALVCSGWVVRNYTVFDRLIFVKSNLFFDLYTGNYVAEDGVYDEDFFLDHHPYAKAVRGKFFLYERVGELRYLDLARQEFLTSFESNPEVYFAKMGQRLLAATVRHKVYNSQETPLPLLLYLLRPLPLLGLVALLWAGRLRLGYVPLVALAVYVTYLLPYIGVAYYTRYLLPLTPVLVLFVFWGADAAVERFRPETHSIPSS